MIGTVDRCPYDFGGETCEGIDVSAVQSVVDWARVANSGVQFAIVKATEGNRARDPRAIENAHGARTAGLFTGAYHFARPDRASVSDAVDEATSFVRVWREAGVFDGPAVLDLETTALTSGETGAWVDAWIRIVRLELGVSTWLYAGAEFLRKTWPNMRARPLLWVPAYPPVKAFAPPTLPLGLPWAMWQYCGNVYWADDSTGRKGTGLWTAPTPHSRLRITNYGGRCDGVNAEVDRNVFRGSLTDLVNLCREDANRPVE